MITNMVLLFNCSIVNVDDMEEDDSNGDETDDDTDDFERSLGM